MAKKEPDTFGALAADLPSPGVVASIDRRIERLKQELLDLWDLRKMAVRRHGDKSAPPTPPAFSPDDAAPTQRASFTNESGGLSVSNIIDLYLSDQRSTIHNVRHATRVHYEVLLKRIRKDHGEKKLADLKAENIEGFFETWAEDGERLPVAKALITMFRQLIKFGMKWLEDSDCQRLAMVLHTMRFASPEPRKGHFTTEMANKIRTAASHIGRQSISLAQAFQFDLKLRQKDVIGEWVPISEPGHNSEFIDDGDKWIRGIRWERIDQNLVLHHTASVDGADIVADLKRAPMVMEELRVRAGIGPDDDLRRDMLPAKGAVIMSESHELPWRPPEFRRKWRQLADQCGVPKNIRNSDSRGEVE